jgi:hypothetical protein
VTLGVSLNRRSRPTHTLKIGKYTTSSRGIFAHQCSETREAKAVFIYFEKYQDMIRGHHEI